MQVDEQDVVAVSDPDVDVVAFDLEAAHQERQEDPNKSSYMSQEGVDADWTDLTIVFDRSFHNATSGELVRLQLDREGHGRIIFQNTFDAPDTKPEILHCTASTLHSLSFMVKGAIKEMY